MSRYDLDDLIEDRKRDQEAALLPPDLLTLPSLNTGFVRVMLVCPENGVEIITLENEAKHADLIRADENAVLWSSLIGGVIGDKPAYAGEDADGAAERETLEEALDEERCEIKIVENWNDAVASSAGDLWTVRLWKPAIVRVETLVEMVRPGDPRLGTRKPVTYQDEDGWVLESTRYRTRMPRELPRPHYAHPYVGISPTFRGTFPLRTRGKEDGEIVRPRPIRKIIGTGKLVPEHEALYLLCTALTEQAAKNGH